MTLADKFAANKTKQTESQTQEQSDRAEETVIQNRQLVEDAQLFFKRAWETIERNAERGATVVFNTKALPVKLDARLGSQHIGIVTHPAHSVFADFQRKCFDQGLKAEIVYEHDGVGIRSWNSLAVSIATTEDLFAIKHRDMFAAFHKSRGIHNLRPINHHTMLVTLTASDNKCFTYPTRGVIHICEMGTDLHVTKAVFHELKEDGSLGPPCSVDNAEFNYLTRKSIREGL